MVYRGKVKGGVVEFEGGVAPPEGTAVRVEPVGGASRLSDVADDPLFRMCELAVDSGISDVATNVDHYLYGAPMVGSDG